MNELLLRRRNNAGNTLLYDAEVEYLQSDSTAYIDTGMAGNNDNLKLIIVFKYITFDNYGPVLGNYIDNSSNCFRCILTASDGSAYVNANNSPNNSTTISCSKNTQHTLTIGYNSKIKIDGNSHNPANKRGTSNSNNICLFNRNLESPVTRDIGLKVYSFQAYNSNTLVLDLIPVRKGTTGYMYDRVSGTLFGNVGSGSFTYGNDVT